MRLRVIEGIRAGIDPDDFGVRESLSQKPRGRADAAAEIEDAAHNEIRGQPGHEALHPPVDKELLVFAREADALMEHLAIFIAQVKENFFHFRISSSAASIAPVPGAASG